MGRSATALVWLVSRAFVVWLLLDRESWVTGDLGYFADSLAGVGDRGVGGTLVEYPLLGVGLLAFPWLLAGAAGHPEQYAEVVMGLALLTDAAYTALLYRAGGRAGAAVWTWLLAVPLLGATAYARFDLVPGVLAGAALLLLAGRPRSAAACAAVATGAKLWPALLLPVLAAPRRTRRAVLAVVAAAGACLAGATVAAVGWDRLVSPLVWQTDRGLQIESVAATPAMVGWSLGPAPWTVRYAASHAYEVDGPGVPALLAAGEVFGVLVAGALVVVYVRAWRSGATVRPEALVWTGLAAVSGFVVSSKVLSPQYLLWLLPLAAAGLVVAGPRRALLRWVGGLLAATALTHLVFPTFYGGLTLHQPWSPRVVLLLALRNLLLLVLFGIALYRAQAGVRAALSGASRWTATLPGRPDATPGPGGAATPTPTGAAAGRPRAAPRRQPGERRPGRPPPPGSRRP